MQSSAKVCVQIIGLLFLLQSHAHILEERQAKQTLIADEGVPIVRENARNEPNETTLNGTVKIPHKYVIEPFQTEIANRKDEIMFVYDKVNFENTGASSSNGGNGNSETKEMNVAITEAKQQNRTEISNSFTNELPTKEASAANYTKETLVGEGGLNAKISKGATKVTQDNAKIDSNTENGSTLKSGQLLIKDNILENSNELNNLRKIENLKISKNVVGGTNIEKMFEKAIDDINKLKIGESSKESHKAIETALPKQSELFSELIPLTQKPFELSSDTDNKTNLLKGEAEQATEALKPVQTITQENALETIKDQSKSSIFEIEPGSIKVTDPLDVNFKGTISTSVSSSTEVSKEIQLPEQVTSEITNAQKPLENFKTPANRLPEKNHEKKLSTNAQANDGKVFALKTEDLQQQGLTLRETFAQNFSAADKENRTHFLELNNTMLKERTAESTPLLDTDKKPIATQNFSSINNANKPATNASWYSYLLPFYPTFLWNPLNFTTNTGNQTVFGLSFILLPWNYTNLLNAWNFTGPVQRLRNNTNKQIAKHGLFSTSNVDKTELRHFKYFNYTTGNTTFYKQNKFNKTGSNFQMWPIFFPFKYAKWQQLQQQQQQRQIQQTTRAPAVATEPAVPVYSFYSQLRHSVDNNNNALQQQLQLPTAEQKQQQQQQHPIIEIHSEYATVPQQKSTIPQQQQQEQKKTSLLFEVEIPNPIYQLANKIFKIFNP